MLITCINKLGEIKFHMMCVNNKVIYSYNKNIFIIRINTEKVKIFISEKTILFLLSFFSNLSFFQKVFI